MKNHNSKQNLHVLYLRHSTMEINSSLQMISFYDGDCHFFFLTEGRYLK